jgi:hypothetical protein
VPKQVLRLLVCLILFGSPGGALPAEEGATNYYYLAIPRCSPDGDWGSVLCMRLDSNGNNAPSQAVLKKKKTGEGSLYTVWYSSPMFVKKYPDSIFATQKWEDFAIGEVPKHLPASIVQFLNEIQKIQNTTDRAIFLQPVFPRQGKSFWAMADHLDVLVCTTTLSAEERSKFIVHSIFKDWSTELPKTAIANVVEALKFYLTGLMEADSFSICYWPQYNILLIKSNAEFEGMAEMGFSLLK